MPRLAGLLYPEFSLRVVHGSQREERAALEAPSLPCAAFRSAGASRGEAAHAATEPRTDLP